MKDFTRDERIMMMLYNPGTRAGLVAELEAMRFQLTPSERRLDRLSRSVLDKLDGMTEAEFDSLDLYPDI
nr:transposon-transfer assisting family protein [uncultured Oscillibacter sp.]